VLANCTFVFDIAGNLSSLIDKVCVVSGFSQFSRWTSGPLRLANLGYRIVGKVERCTRTNNFGAGYFIGFAKGFGTCALVASKSVRFICEVGGSGEIDGSGFGTENVRAGEAGFVG
jgi:sulfite exporter TauE/SafE